MPGRLLITGASGYIGAALLRQARNRGLQVAVLGSTSAGSPDPGVQVYPWRLGEAVPGAALEGVTAMIHVAHFWRADEAGAGDDNPNFTGSLQLAQASAAAGCPRFVYVSSTAAHEQALNAYGKIKRRTEGALLERYPGQVLVARPGLVYGGAQKGIFGLLSKLVRVFPLLPLVGGATLLQPVHVDEVCAGLLSLALLAQPDRSSYVLAHPQPIAFADYLRLLRRTATGRKLWLIPIPVTLALWMCDLTRLLPGFPTISRERVYGLIAARPMPSADDLRALGLLVSDIRIGLLRAPRCGRRRLIAESRAVLRYLCAGAAPAVLRQLVRAVERNDGGEPLYLGAMVLRWPALLRWLDPLPRRATSRLVRRLEMGLALQAVAAPRVRPGFAGLFLQGVCEGLALPSRLLAGLLQR